MADQVQNLVSAGRFSVRTTDDTLIAQEATCTGALAVDQRAPSLMDMSRAGRRFLGGGGTATATGRAPVQIVPTTTAAFGMWNGSATRSYVIEKLHAAQISGTAAVGITLFAGLSTAAVAAPSAATGYGYHSASRGGLSSAVVFGDNLTVTSPAPWMCVATSGAPATTTNGGISADINGAIIIKPGYALYWAIMSGTGTSPLFVGFAQWIEMELDLE